TSAIGNLKKEQDKAAEKRADEILKNTATPAEKFVAEMREAQRLLKAGLIDKTGLDRAAYGFANAAGLLKEASGGVPKAMEQGSAEAVDTLSRAAARRGGASNVQELIKANLDTIIKQNTRQQEIGQDIVDAVNNQVQPDPADFAP